jgi:hypothetical protein
MQRKEMSTDIYLTVVFSPILPYLTAKNIKNININGESKRKISTKENGKMTVDQVSTKRKGAVIL